MLKVAGGMSGFSLLAIPFFILTGAIMAVGGMAERLINLAKVFVGADSRRYGAGQHRRLDDVRLHLGLLRCRYRRGWRRHDPANDQDGLSAPVRGQCHDFRFASAVAGAAVAQHDHLFDRGRWDGFGRPSVHGRNHSSAIARAVAGHPRFVHRARTISRKASKSRSAKSARSLDAVWGMVTHRYYSRRILSGVFTPTESGAVACVYAFLVTMFVYRDVKWSESRN